MSRLFCLCLCIGFLGCEPSPPPPRAAKVDPASKPAAKPSEGPPLAKNDPRFQPYVPKPRTPMDFSGVDVGEEALAGSQDSLDALGTSIVAALNERDAKALTALAISESEYKDRFFPVTVNHVSGFGLGADLAWAELHGESSGDMHTAMERFGGQELTFVRVDVEEVVARPKVKLYRSPTLVVRDATGAEQTLVMLGSLLEHTPSGGFKVLAFRDTR